MLYNHQLIRIIIGCIGILSIFSHFIAATLWIAYITGWRTIRKLKCLQQEKEINSISSSIVATTTTTTTTTSEVILHRNNVNFTEQKISLTKTKQNLIWPVCSLRMSTQIIILSMEMIYILGCCTDLVRLIHLSITGDDLRLLFGDGLCRLQIFLSFISCDVSGWHLVCLCIERCYITLFPRKYYSMNHSSIGPALVMILFVYTISMSANLFLFIPNQPICSGLFRNKSINAIKFSITFIIPVLIVTVSTIVMITVLVKWKLKNIKTRSRISISKHNSMTINKVTCISPTKSSCISITHSSSTTGQQQHHHHHHQQQQQQKTNSSYIAHRKHPTVVRLVVYNTSARITVAKMMLVCAILYLFTLLSLFVFGSIYKDYCCFFVAKNNCNWNDNIFNLMSILYWFAQSIINYVLMLGAVTIRHDIQIMIWFIWQSIIRRN
ncbi:hypothetical protein EWB00_000659 [Schistosoma japonicum]|uniref:G-protein coupled receptors family 1 profile domain-containing protein n=1 Tax=Schistosoma japonicum TaxID=6182 RepID=A0A4Z2DI55_SCHJA|nr:hypothetical protein EWB00_000659 [Schistosoma japonicum]